MTNGLSDVELILWGIGWLCIGFGAAVLVGRGMKIGKDDDEGKD